MTKSARQVRRRPSRHSSLLPIIPLAAALLLLAGIGAILMPVLQMDREIRREVEEYAQLREAARLPAFSGRKSYLGTLFSLDGTDYETPGRNIGIYGHHIRSSGETMFSPLLSYKDPEFCAAHAVIYLDSLYHSAAYRVFAAVNLRSGEWDPATARFAGDEDFLAFVRRARAQALYDTGIEPGAEDEILTLITCDRSYSDPDGRLVVMAVREY